MLLKISCENIAGILMFRFRSGLIFRFLFPDKILRGFGGSAPEESDVVCDSVCLREEQAHKDDSICFL